MLASEKQTLVYHRTDQKNIRSISQQGLLLDVNPLDRVRTTLDGNFDAVAPAGRVKRREAIYASVMDIPTEDDEISIGISVNQSDVYVYDQSHYNEAADLLCRGDRSELRYLAREYWQSGMSLERYLHRRPNGLWEVLIRGPIDRSRLVFGQI